MISEWLDIKSERMKAKPYHVEHHAAHMSSAFMVPPFREAAVVSVDGFGDCRSKDGAIDIIKKLASMTYPPSLEPTHFWGEE